MTTTQRRVNPVDREISNADIESESQTPPPPASGESFPPARLETPYLAEQTSSQAAERWQQIQANFVDDPRKAVGDAHQLVDELVQRIVERFAQERDNLEGQWSTGGDVSTEDLRVCLQNYRTFFTRLLPAAIPGQREEMRAPSLNASPAGNSDWQS
jgi:hypothetical protein